MCSKHSFTSKIEVPPFLQALCQELGIQQEQDRTRQGEENQITDKRHMAASAVQEPQQGNVVERNPGEDLKFSGKI